MADAAGIQTSPWHAGELALQRRAGVAERMVQVGRFVRDHLIDQHRQFYPQLPFILAGAVDGEGNAWATLLSGRPGFLSSPDPQRLQVMAARNPHDPADQGMNDGDAIGLLGIELHTRRRNRLNGTLRRGGGDTFEVGVEHSFGNCPQYIQLRDFAFVRDPAIPVEAPIVLDYLDERARAMIAAADTFFVASYAEREAKGETDRQVDVSHRGGKAGFVRVGGDGTLTIPDFAGNLHFNTLGNILLNGKAGMLFVDFENGDLLQMTGDAEVILESPEIAAFQGAERLWRLTPRRVIHRPGALPLRWIFRAEGWSPNSLMTGDWQEADAKVKAMELAQRWRRFRIAQIVEESAAVRSLYLAPCDGAGIAPYHAGQHLPIRVTPSGANAPVLRTYTLSAAPSDGGYRLSVKRQGAVSRHLHALSVGDEIEARAPAGQFTLDASVRRPLVLLAAGIGITPMLAMLRHIVFEGKRTRRTRLTWLFYAARSKADRAFDAEIATLAAEAQGAIHIIRTLSDKADAVAAVDYEVPGRIDMALLRATLPVDDYDFYLCGPAPFTQSLYNGLRSLNAADHRIHAEAFGPASLRRDSRRSEPADADVPVPVLFTRSGKEARWQPGSGSLLDLAEARGLKPDFSCRGGSCGTCRTRILAGKVAYATQPSFEVAQDEALICCAVPAAPTDGESRGLRLDL
jgi:uncharacterized protein